MLNEQFVAKDGTLKTKLEVAIQRLKSFEPPEGYFVAFSGGKDSQCIYHLCEMAGVKFDAHYRVTSVDPPELIHFIREHYPDVIFDFPRDADGKRITMWSLIVKHGVPPSRWRRYCCGELKENNGAGQVVVTGVRWAESQKRRENHGVAVVRGKPKHTKKKADELEADYRVGKYGDSVIMANDNDGNRKLVEQCYKMQRTTVNPIVDWTDNEVWEFLNDVAKVPHCSMYDEGFKRLGCIGCPLAGIRGQQREFERFPQYKKLYLKAFERMLQERKNKGLETTWETAEDVLNWWIGGGTAEDAFDWWISGGADK